MGHSSVIRTFALAALAVGGLAACEREAPRDTVRLQVEEAPDYMQPAGEAETETPELTDAARDTIEQLRAIINSNSIYRLARFAGQQEGFISNFAGASHRDHWDLLRRTGFDPVLRLNDLLNQPYGTKQVGGETWYIWPDLAALDRDALQPERLNFRQRARLEELVGDSGIAEIRAGSGYPGVRTAIAEDGRWLYYVHESENEE
ncbi:hypothetical protein [Henriciella aquimarina]|uniref:hypothetical protein n=1 Tax=Henriciella aquimarina TaxID=545261 RepID=UPI000A0432BA|nr:hypothetical protein [Henriciella aquimarina]